MGGAGWPAAEVLTAGEVDPSPPFLSDSEIIARITSDDIAFQLWRNGYERGLVEGSVCQKLDDENLANLAAAIAISRVENQVKVRATIQNAIKNIDVIAAREATRRALALRTSQRDGQYENPGAPNGDWC